MTAALLALTRPRAERPWWLRRSGTLGIGVLVLLASLLGALDQPDDAQAIGLPDLNPAHWAVKGFVAILNFLFGDTIKQLAGSFLHLLLNVPDLTNRASFAKLNQYYDFVQGAAWGLLSLSFIAAVLMYWSSSYTASGSQQAAQAFARTIGAIGMLVSLPVAFREITGAMNALTDGMIQNPVVGQSMGEIIKTTLTAGLASGGVALLVSLAALVCALILAITKIITIALLAVFYVLAPLAIGVWPFEPLAWALKTLLGAALALLIFPVVWAACFGVFAVLTTDQLFTGDVVAAMGNDLLKAMVGLAAFVIAFKLPFAVLRLAMGAGLVPSPSRALQTVYYARSMAGAVAAA